MIIYAVIGIIVGLISLYICMDIYVKQQRKLTLKDDFSVAMSVIFLNMFISSVSGFVWPVSVICGVNYIIFKHFRDKE